MPCRISLRAENMEREILGQLMVMLQSGKFVITLLVRHRKISELGKVAWKNNPMLACGIALRTSSGTSKRW